MLQNGIENDWFDWKKMFGNEIVNWRGKYIDEAFWGGEEKWFAARKREWKVEACELPHKRFIRKTVISA